MPIKSSQSSVTVPSVPPVYLTISVHNNVIKKPITCRDSVVKSPRKCLCKSTIVKNRNAVNYVSESVNNVVKCSRFTSRSPSGFLCQPVCFNKSVHKHISSSVFTIAKCKNKFYDIWIQFLILFLLVTLNYGNLSCNIDRYYLKANTIVNNLTACLIFIKYHIYNFSDCLGEVFVRALFFLFKLIPILPD